MTAALAIEPKVCPNCQGEFVDPTPLQSRTYCLTCRPPKGGAVLPAPLPFERVSAGAFTVEHFRGWSGGFRLKDGSFFELDDYQGLFLEDLFARDADGLPVFQELWLILPEGNGKTTFLSLVVLYVIEFTPEAWVPVAASARDQAVDLTYRIAAGFVKRNGLEDSSFKLHPGYRQIIHTASLGAAKIFASDAASGDGVDPTLALIEELHRLASMELYETWAGKLEKSNGQLVVVSTAGEPGGEFEELRARIRQSATETHREGCYLRAAGSSTVIHEYALPEKGDPEDISLVVQANPFSGITVESLERKRAKPSWNLPHWRRFTCNLPTRGGNPAVSELEWADALAKGTKKEPNAIPAGEDVWAGLDLGWKDDTTAWVPFWPRDAGYRLLGEATILEPPRNGVSLEVGKIKRAITETAESFALHTVVMDVTRGEDVAEWIRDQGIDVIERGQSNAFAVMDYERFMEGLRQGWLKHCGGAEFTKHVLNAVARLLPGGDTRFDRPKEARKSKQQRLRVIDGLVAAAMVNSVVWAELHEPEEEADSWRAI